ncbi:hypothetical protein TcasGA2_TC034328 [Tribolium castaneum]|uniref:Uncharacterized protein n=1 Tax=Tribolium castaneum TaxID=7070 RepID=A0A139WCC1_TRICA|nr:hypothetical protein TcasGA2_TC034328 [Tribolium castaneum]
MTLRNESVTLFIFYRILFSEGSLDETPPDAPEDAQQDDAQPEAETPEVTPTEEPTEATPTEEPEDTSKPTEDTSKPTEDAAKAKTSDSPFQGWEKKKKVLVDPNATIKDILENSHYLTALPVVPEEEASYKPILYTFRVKAKGRATKLKHITTKPPPFYLQFDHTIAVIWTLFNKESNKETLGIVQLQWALYFLEGIYNDEGVHPKDVQLCIDTIQDYLIAEYAEISEESVIYGHSTYGDFIKKEATSVPFSPNYAQMIEKCPKISSSAEGDDTVFLDQNLLNELENVKKVVGIESIDLTKVVSKDQVMNILNDWKKEQIGKIQDELKMLYVVEDMLKNSDSQHFDGYTDESQFETIFRKNK